MTYLDCLKGAMKSLADDPATCVVGYNSTAGGTCECFPKERRFEMPLAENLMSGAAIGMALDGRIPIVWYERADFLTCGMDAIVNHADKLSLLSEGLHRPGIIFRVAVGNKNVPLYSGPTHTQNFAVPMRDMVAFPVHQLRWKTDIAKRYVEALTAAKRGRCTMLFEFRDMYATE